MGKKPIVEPGVPEAKAPLCSGDGPFRPNVAALVIRRGPNGVELLLGERYDTPNCWQWPQGGRKKKEKAKVALHRELMEEIGIADARILYRFPFKLRYRFPVKLSKRFKGRIGQEQTYFVVTPDMTQPDLAKALDQEFRDLRWFPLEEAHAHAVWFKRGVYATALNHLVMVLPGLEW